jgi:Tol biopolymer transport system component
VRGSRPIAVALALSLLAASVVASIAAGKSGEEPTTVLVSRAGKAGKGGDANSLEPSLSGDGRFVAFVSRAKNLSPAAKSGAREVFVRDMQTGEVALASRGSGPGGAAATGFSGEPSISADGRYVAFTSNDQDLGGEAAPEGGIYVRDLQTDVTVLASRANGATGAAGDGFSHGPSLSADGLHVAFESTANNLVPDDSKAPQEDVFVRDLAMGVTELISRADGAAGPAATDWSFEPSISADGNRVAFASRAPLSAEDVDAESFPEDVFVRDRAAGTTALVSRASGPTGAPSDVESDEPAISADGLHVAFSSDAKLTGQKYYGTHLFVRDLTTATTQLVSTSDQEGAFPPRREPSLSADGRYVAFMSGANKISPVDADGRPDVFVRDMGTGLTVTVSRASGTLGGPGDGPSLEPSISADGQSVAFMSRATNLSSADDDKAADVFLRHVVYAKEPALPKCAGRTATLIGTPGPDVLKGTKRKDVVIALGGNDRIDTYTQGDVICGGAGRDTIDAGDNGEGGSFDLVRGGPGADKITLGPELGKAFGDGGNDVLLGSKGGDELYGGPGNDLLRGGPNPTYNSDFLYGGPGNDRLYGGPGPNYVKGGPGRDVEVGGNRE